MRASSLVSGQHERETKTLFFFSDDAQKKQEGFFFGLVKRDFCSGKEKNWGQHWEKQGNYLFSFETMYLFGLFSFLLSCPFPDFFILYFRARRPGGKTTDITANNREMARVQGGMDLEPVISVFFSLFHFLEGELVWVIGFRSELGLDLGQHGTGEGGTCYVDSSKQQTDFFSFFGIGYGQVSFPRFLVHDFVPTHTPISSPHGKRILGRFFTESACRLTVSIEVIVHDTRAPNKEDLPSIIFNLPMILHLLRTFCLSSLSPKHTVSTFSTHCAMMGAGLFYF